MSRRDPTVTVREMLDFVEEARTLAAGHSRDDLGRDLAFTRSSERVIELIGEAAKRLPQEIRDAAKSVKWSEVIGMRNQLIHAYHTISHDIVWDVLQNKLDALEHALREVLRKLQGAR